MFLFQNAVIPSGSDYRLLDYCFNDLSLDDDDTVKASIRMFMDLDFLDKFRIDYEVSVQQLEQHRNGLYGCTVNAHMVNIHSDINSSDSDFFTCPSCIFTHNFVSWVQSFYFSEFLDAIVLQTCHEK